MKSISSLRLAIWLFAGLLGAANGFAQSPGVPVRFWGGGTSVWNWELTPGGVSIGVSGLESSPGANDGYKWIYGNADAALFACTNGTTYHETAYLQPGKTYDVSWSGGWVSEVYAGFAAPPGYVIEINGKPRYWWNETISSPSEFYSGGITLRIVATNGAAFAPGEAGDLSESNVRWEVALGSLLNGRSAGTLAVINAGTGANWNALFSPASLYYSETSDEVSVYQVSGRIRQIIAPATVVDVVTSAEDSGLTATQWEIRFYNPDHVSGSGFPRSFTNQPFVVYRLEDGGTSTTLEITSTTRQLEESGTPVKRTAITSIARTGTSPIFSWARNNWNKSGESQVLDTATTGGGSSGARTEGITRSTTATSSDPILETNTYSLKAWGEALVSKQLGSSYPITVSQDYYDTGEEAGRYGFLKQVVKSGGEWEAYDYYTASFPSSETGIIKYRFRPFNTSPSTVSFTASQGEVTYFEYANDPFGKKTRPSLVETKVNNVLVSRSATTYSNVSGTINGMNVVEAVRQDRTTSSSGDYLTTTTRFYREDTTDEFFRTQPHAVTLPNGVKSVYAYQRGTWSSGSFTKSGSAGLGAGTASRISVITGSTNSSAGAAYTSFDGYDIDDLYLVSGKSTRQDVIRDNRALVARANTYVWDGSIWVLIGSTEFTYALNGRLVETESLSGATWSATYSGDQKLTETDAAGTKQFYVYDDAGFVASVTKEAGGSLSHDLKTSFTYDAIGHVLTTVVSAVGSPTVTETITTLTEYDDAGRVTVIKPPGIQATTIAYNPAAGTRSITKPSPDSGTTVETTQLDGRLVSVTGSSVVAQYYSYGVESDGRRWTRLDVGSSSSSRYQKAWTDWIGRSVKTQKPGWDTNPSAVELRFYNTSSGYLEKIRRQDSNDSLFFVDTLHAYDELGRLKHVAHDMNSNNQIDLGGTDRITEFGEYFELTDSAWWATRIQKRYTTNSTTATHTDSISRTRLTEFSGIQFEQRVTDTNGNVVSKTMTVDRPNKTVTVETTAVGYTNPHEEERENGLVTATTEVDGLTFTRTYDALGRLSTQGDPRTGNTTTTYEADSTLVASVYDAFGTIATYSWDNAGRMEYQGDAATKFARFTYNPRGQITHRWGDTVSPIKYVYNDLGERIEQHTYQGSATWTGTTWPSSPGTADVVTWDYDPATGLLNSKTDALSKSVDYTYNVRGQILEREWARLISSTRVKKTFVYDGGTGELTGETYNDGTASTGYYYNRLGHIYRIDDATGTRYLDHCACGRVEQEHFDTSFYGSRILTFSADTSSGTGGTFGSYTKGTVKGRPTGFTLGTSGDLDSDLSQAHVYSNLGRLVGVTTQIGTASARDYTYTYTANSDLLAECSTTNYSLTRAYSSTRNLLTALENEGAYGADAALAYTHDSLGRVQTVKRTGYIYEPYYAVEGNNPYGYTSFFELMSYNDRNELASSKMFHGDSVSTSPSSTDELPGRRYEYRYDPQGNRLSSGSQGSVLSGDDEYTSNAANQYTLRDNARSRFAGFHVFNFNQWSVSGAVLAEHNDNSWGIEIVPSNNAGAVKGTFSFDTWESDPEDIAVIDVPYFAPIREQVIRYDDDGNLKHDTVWNYHYDAENRLTRMEHRHAGNISDSSSDPHSHGSGKLQDSDLRRIDFLYDYAGRRVQKTVYGFSSGSYLSTPLRKHRYLYDGWNLVAEFDAASSLTLRRSYTWGLDANGSLRRSGGIAALLQIHDYGTSQTFAPAYDGSGNVVSLINLTYGTGTELYEYGPFGEQRNAASWWGGLPDNAFRYSTKFTDSETGLVCYGHRYYSPTLGRFITRDPIEESGGVNLYSFANNNAMSFYDFRGLNAQYLDGGGEPVPLPGTEVRADSLKKWWDDLKASMLSRVAPHLAPIIPLLNPEDFLTPEGTNDNKNKGNDKDMEREKWKDGKIKSKNSKNEDCWMSPHDAERLGAYIEHGEVKGAINGALEQASFTDKIGGEAGDFIDLSARYIFTSDGWVDLRHVVAAAGTGLPGFSDAAGLGVEIRQWFAGDESAFQMEDFRSNYIGGQAALGRYATFGMFSIADQASAHISLIGSTSYKEALDTLCKTGPN